MDAYVWAVQFYGPTEGRSCFDEFGSLIERKTGMLKYFVCVILSMAVLACGENDPLSAYEPRDPQEAALKTLMLDFQEAVNSGDAANVAGLIHEDASLVLGKDHTVYTKEAYIKLLSEKLPDSPPIGYGLPKIKIAGDLADVKIYLKSGGKEFLILYKMKLENNRWYIYGWEY